MALEMIRFDTIFAIQMGFHYPPSTHSAVVDKLIRYILLLVSTLSHM